MERNSRMKEKSLRSAHRMIGVPLVLFILVQSMTGTIISLGDLLGQEWSGGVKILHLDMGTAGMVYRVLLGMGILFMACTGLWIYLKIRERSGKPAKS